MGCHQQYVDNPPEGPSEDWHTTDDQGGGRVLSLAGQPDHAPHFIFTDSDLPRRNQII